MSINNKGFVLIEMIIYTALFSIMMGGLVVVAYQLSENTSDVESKISAQEEINFVSKKLDWIFTGVRDITLSGNTLEVIKGGDIFKLRLDGTDGKIKLDDEDLTTENVKVNAFSFVILGGTPEGVEITLTIDGVTNVFNKYVKI